MGGWLCEYLLSLGAQVTGYALPAPTSPSLFVASGLEKRVPTVTADIRDLDRLSAIMESVKPDVVFHLAAQPLVRTAFAEPVETFETNLMGTINVMEAIRRTDSVSTAIIMTTDKVYENREWHWGYRETDRLGGREPYGLSKACAEFAVQSYVGSYFGGANSGPGVATVRAGNIIGGGDWAADRIVPDAMRAFSEARKLEIRNPDAVRPWQHVMEPVAGMSILAERLASDGDACGGGWNFGPEENAGQTVSWLADHLVAAWGNKAAWEQTGETGPHEAKFLTLSSAKAKAELDWQCKWSAEEAIAHTVEWYRAFYEGVDMAAFTQFQINAYVKGDESGEQCRSEIESRGRAVA